MRPAGRVVAECHQIIREMIRPGLTTLDLDQAVEAHLQLRNARGLFKGVPGVTPFPNVTCISVNDEVVHGIPSKRVLEAGDIVSVDIGAELNGWCGDSAWSYAVGQVSPERARLLAVGQETLEIAIDMIPKCRYWSQVALAMQEHVFRHDLGVVVDFVGHGIGRKMHEPPEVPNYWLDDMDGDFKLVPGLVLAIEPMVNEKSSDVFITKDNWTIKTIDQGASVHFEHTVAVTENGPLILTSL